MPITTGPIDTLKICINADLSLKMKDYFLDLKNAFTVKDAKNLLDEANKQLKRKEQLKDRIAIILINNYIAAHGDISYELKTSLKKSDKKGVYLNNELEEYFELQRLVSQRWRGVYFQKMLEKANPKVLSESNVAHYALSQLNEVEVESDGSILQGFKNSLGEEYAKLFSPNAAEQAHAEKRKLEKEVDVLKTENKKIRSTLDELRSDLNNLKEQHESLLRVLSPSPFISTSSSSTSSSASSMGMLTLNRHRMFSNSAPVAVETPDSRQVVSPSNDYEMR